jgi:hypothetical protein
MTNKNIIITLNKYSTKSYTLSLKNGKYISGFNYSPKATFKFDLIPSVTLNPIEEVIGSVKYIVGYNQVINPYFTLKNPTLALDDANTSYALVFQKMGIIINNKLMTDATVYQVLDVNICQNSAVKIMPNSSEQLIVLNQIDLAALMSFKFDLVFEMDKTKVSCTSSDGTKVDLGLPTSLTYNDLSNLNSEFGVFAKSCNSCHAGPNAAGALDLTDATQAKAKAARIQSRMNDFTNPMPRSGILSAKERGAVDVWINSGLK